jgi:hypothetical protein
MKLTIEAQWETNRFNSVITIAGFQGRCWQENGVWRWDARTHDHDPYLTEQISAGHAIDEDQAKALAEQAIRGAATS